MRNTPSKESVQGDIALFFGAAQYGELVAAGLLGAIPTTTWTLLLLAPLDGHLPAWTQNAWMEGVFVFLFLVTILVLPWLLPCLALWARQPLGARITWNDDEVTEWDGPEKRTILPWNGLVAAQKTWQVGSRRVSRTVEALQLRGETGVITVWPTEAPGDPSIRRRLCSDEGGVLRQAVQDRRIPIGTQFDAALAMDPERPSHRGVRWLGRAGYVLGVIAPLIAGPAPVWGLALAVLSAPLLGIRALPALQEAWALFRQPHRNQPFRLRAALAEGAIRCVLVGLPLLSTGLGVFF